MQLPFDSAFHAWLASWPSDYSCLASHIAYAWHGITHPFGPLVVFATHLLWLLVTVVKDWREALRTAREYERCPNHRPHLARVFRSVIIRDAITGTRDAVLTALLTQVIVFPVYFIAAIVIHRMFFG